MANNLIENESKKDPQFNKKILTSAMVLGKNGKPQTVAELHERLHSYFQSCADDCIRPGVESLSAALCVSRQTFWRWCRGELGVSQEWREECEAAKSIISMYLEQAALWGKINPATSIFLMKNWLGYTDTISIDQATPEDHSRRALSADDLPIIKKAVSNDLPVMEGGASYASDDE